jgi:hypothetical protein
VILWLSGDYQNSCGVFNLQFFAALGPCSHLGRDEAGDRFVVGFFEGSREEKVIREAIFGSKLFIGGCIAVSPPH